MPYTVIGADGREYGPVEIADLKSWLGENRLTLQSQVKDVTTGQILFLGSLPEFAGSASPYGNPQTPQQPPMAQPSGNPYVQPQPGFQAPMSYAAYPRADVSMVGERPPAITIISVLLALGGIASPIMGIGFIMLPNSPVRPVNISPEILVGIGILLIVSGIINFAIAVGLWQMKKWAAYTYFVVTLIGQIISIALGSFNIIGICVILIVVAYIVKYLPRMT